jgi:predicted short-subunit dehydrogenase-like oxidoreductase (DUF2520 family)
MQNQKLSFIGAGTVSLSVAESCSEAGYHCLVGTRNIEKAKSTCKAFGLSLKVTNYKEAVKDADVIFIGVADDAITEVAKELYKNGDLKSESLLIHFSGVLTSNILKHEKLRLPVASAHPLQTFPTIDIGINTLKDTFWFCEGDKKALTFLQDLIPKISRAYKTIDSNAKTFYHLSAVFACNYLTSLMELSLTCADRSNIQRGELFEALKPLINSTLNNIETNGTTKALTGPIARGDIETISKHLKKLNDDHGEILLESYKNLGKVAVKLSDLKGIANKEDLKEIEKLLNKTI